MTYTVGEIEVLQRKIGSSDDPAAKHPSGQSSPKTTVLQPGFRREEDCRSIQAPTIWESDIKVPLRDGSFLLADIFRPVDAEDVPAILVWSPYGKTGTGILSLDVTEGRVGIPKERLSGFESFEAPDPAEWVPYGYAIVNVNARGILGSDGDHRWHGTSEGQDGYDAIEFIASLPWTNGRIALMGNSWLGSSQWFIAAEQPPHLSCMLPLEGLSDVYRESLCRGGVPYKPFWTFLMGSLSGNNNQEDVIAMIDRYPLMNEYWEDKRAKSHLIKAPAYVLASMSSALHTIGSLRSFEDIPHEEKWLRMHPTQEWHDLYQEDSIADMKRFLDFYTKGISNGWEKTPRARISVLRFNQPPFKNIPYSQWPIKEAEYQSLYLSANNLLAESQSAAVPGTASYQGDIVGQQMDDDPEKILFRHTFQETTRLIGTSKATLWLSCQDHNDFDVFVQIRKADRSGKILRNVNIPLQELGVDSEAEVQTVNTLKYLGPTGILRASHRAFDPILSKPHWPAHDHSKLDLVPPGEIVKLEISLWPAAIQFEPGEQLILKVAGHHMTLAEFEPLRGGFVTGNKGRQVLYFGGGYESKLEIPCVRG
ncbi:uncharacterized protein N7503_000932 [Penicillium pulvis]|uniref:uncharacterized protein n=1 Tax=Penicillium pulvis TaxID=1562058 RepID=UPI00254761F1|nr:uncharacterized protein N7503_000932 [Penicillium pulvis]KAJ5814182.1 hypothetical protein N7503_000932 [Penicillium pulvis]